MQRIFTKEKRRVVHQPHTPSPKTNKNTHRHSKVVVVIASIVAGIIVATSLIWWFWEEPLLSPINSLTTFRFLGTSEIVSDSEKIVYGFLPYWNVKQVAIHPELTHLAYFALTIGPDGNLITRMDDAAEPGYNRLGSEEFLELSNVMRARGGSTELVLSQFNADDIYSFLSSETAQNQLLLSLDSILLAYPVSGINIDIELSGSTTPALRANLTQFMKKLRTHLNTKYSHVQLSIDMYAGAASSPQIWEVAEIAPHVDYIVVMAYDFHQRSSPLAGPVAPLFGGQELWDSDINQHLEAFSEVVPPEKLLLGIPFYGYEWQTTSRDSQSHTFPDTGSTASIRRVNELLARKEELEVQEHWNEAALSPYLSYKVDDELYVIYYENSRSISYKLDYVNQLDLGGIAIWALGYEGDSRELWDVINKKMQLSPTEP